jgi:Fe-S cluster assembly protein SufD
VNFSSHSIATGAKLSRNNLRTTLDGEHIEAILNGVYLTNGDQLADHYMIVDHAKPNCASHEYFNGILAGKSKGVFHGRILVRPDAQKTDAKQTNKNLLLSDDASADTKPQLEIYADDVKCTHGATIGQLNDESIYYLRSRGIGSRNRATHVDPRLRWRDHRPRETRRAARRTRRARLGSPRAAGKRGGGEMN